MNVKSYVWGLLVCLQFFSSLPIPISFKMDRDMIKRTVMMFPILGLIMGGIVGSLLFCLSEWTTLSSLALAFIVWVLPIILTGGIHLDGWMDSSDAYFSYQDKEKRLEIMKDPRAGAFAVISVIVLLSSRFLFIYESMILDSIFLATMIGIIPFFSRIIMGILMVTGKTAKEEGMAHYFKQHTGPMYLLTYLIPYVLIAVIFFWVLPEIADLFLLFTLAAGLLTVWIRRQTIKWFGGITGDTLGASVEGAETVLWLIVWLSAYTGMA
ncbi:adenosylcobinamide-GDP ribazoletransferase [Rossellomorea sp. NS-SX7]|uniref:adenosylcobinamide-GDP ribazoletransferase n=1 Tax=Rossellomorea sp. NS-SX7 TaxID=3463856 RepID=UPI00405A2F82